MRIWFPIRYKFLAVTTLLLVFSVVAYLYLASNIFRRDKVELVFDLNRGAVTGLASDVSTVFHGVADKMKLAAVLSQDHGARSRALLTDVLENDSNIVFLAASYGFQSLDHTFFSDQVFGETYGLSDAYFSETLASGRPIPFLDIQTQGEAVWNATLPDGPPLIGFGKSVVPDLGTDAGTDVSPEAMSDTPPGAGGRERAPFATGGRERAPFAMVAFVRADKLLASFSSSKLNEVIAVDRDGRILVHPVAELMAEARSMENHPLVQRAVSQPVRTGVMAFNHDDHEILGAYSFSHGGRILILSQVDGRQAFSAVSRLVQRSLVFALIIVTLAFLAAVFFSRSLTKPIQALVETMGRVAKGELSTSINVRTRDEIALLANSFNSMLGDLRASREELEEVNRDLERKVKDRTLRLEEQNVAVKRAQEALLQSTRLATVGEVAGRAAHEVLNPLTSIVNRIERVRSRIESRAVQEVELIRGIVKSWENDLSEGGFNRLVESWQAPSSLDHSISIWQEDLDNVKRMQTTMHAELKDLLSDMEFVLKESQRINKIVQNMRSLTRVKGAAKLVSARELLHEAVKIMADLGQEHGIEFIENYGASHDCVEVDPDEFIQCATNLLRNAIQAIAARARLEPGLKGEIVVTTADTPEGVSIDIADNGAGIAVEHEAKLFEIQFSTKPADEGTGLGLTITRRFIRAFGGDIVLLRSEPGRGCAFRINLPGTRSTEMTEDMTEDTTEVMAKDTNSEKKRVAL